MCGIAGLIGPDLRDARHAHALRQMLDTIRHRGPDDEGVYEEPRIRMGIRRLSIIDINAGHQPQFNEDRSLAIVFNGEIYNYLELQADLRSEGHRFATNSDTEVILHLYEDHGIDALQKLNGMFAFCIWDAREKRAILARDRVGIKPLYVAQTPDALYFASELKAFRQTPVPFDLDFTALGKFLQFGFIPAPATPFTAIRKVLPGTVLEIAAEAVTERTYWSVPPAQPPANPAALRDEFRALLEDAIRLQLRSDVPVGVFLSGGIDSSLVAAVVAQQTSRLQSYTVSYEGGAVDEQKFAAVVAERSGFVHHVVTASSLDLLATLPTMLWHLDEPHGDPANLGAFIVSRRAAEDVKVVLTGTGGDELFGGYHRHIRSPLKRLLQATPGPIKEVFEAAFLATPALREVGVRLRRNRDADRAFLWALLTFPSDGTAGVLPGAGLSRDDELSEVYAYYQREGDSVNRMLYADARFYLTDDVLLMLDKLTMAASIEGRVPLLDHRLVEFAFRLPGRLKVPGTETKQLFKSWIRDLVPAEVLNRPKWGFAGPVDGWMRRGLFDAGARLLDARPPERDTFFWGLRGEPLRARLRSLTAQQLYHLFVLETWLRTMVDGVPHDMPLDHLVGASAA